MNALLQNLLKLQSLELDEITEKDAGITSSELRENIPPQILGHHDRLIARGKKSVAIVRDQVCTGCHMRLPIGTITTLMHGTDIRLCDTCGRYLYLPEPQEMETPELPKPKSAKRGRKPKAVVSAV